MHLHLVRCILFITVMGYFFSSWTTSGELGYEVGISIKKLFAAQINFKTALRMTAYRTTSTPTITMTAEKWVAAAASASTKRRPPRTYEGAADSPRPCSSKD